MLKAKGKDDRRSRTLEEAINDVKKKETAQIAFVLDKETRVKFLIKTKQNNTNMNKELINFIHRYIEN